MMEILKIVLADIFILAFLPGFLAAWLAGRSLALGWRPFLHVVLYAFLLAAGVRFLDYALFDGSFLALDRYVMDWLFVFFVAFLSYRWTRAGQLVSQYPWIYRRPAFFYIFTGGND